MEICFSYLFIRILLSSVLWIRIYSYCWYSDGNLVVWFVERMRTWTVRRRMDVSVRCVPVCLSVFLSLSQRRVQTQLSQHVLTGPSCLLPWQRPASTLLRHSQTWSTSPLTYLLTYLHTYCRVQQDIVHRSDMPSADSALDAAMTYCAAPFWMRLNPRRVHTAI